MKLIIGNCNYSSWSLRPWLFLRHHQIPFETQRISLFTDTMEQEMTPFFSDGKVPVLQDDGLEVWDSLAILEYLAERYPDKGGWPADAGGRAVARSVSAEMHSSFSALRSEMPMNCRRRFPGFALSEQGRRDVDRLFAVWRYCRTRYGQQGPWLFGGFTVADCMFAPVVMRLVSYEIALDATARDYVDTLYASEAAREWVELGRLETEVIEEDEADWPSVAL
jgi:glutathione S-transferase